jgi:hypothetical protein
MPRCGVGGGYCIILNISHCAALPVRRSLPKKVTKIKIKTRSNLMTLLYDDDFIFFFFFFFFETRLVVRLRVFLPCASSLFSLFVGLVLWRSGFFSESRDSLHPQRCALPGGVIFTPSLSFFFTFYLYKGRQATSVLLTLALASTNAI